MFRHAYTATKTTAIQPAIRHEQSLVVSKTDNFAGHFFIIANHNMAAGANADASLQAGYFDKQSLNANNAAVSLIFLERVELGQDAFQYSLPFAAKAGNIIASAVFIMIRTRIIALIMPCGI